MGECKEQLKKLLKDLEAAVDQARGARVWATVEDSKRHISIAITELENAEARVIRALQAEER